MISPKLNINFKPISFGLYVDKLQKNENYLKAKLINCIISKNSYIGESSYLEYSIIGENVRIGKKCKISKCIILPNTEINDNTIINNTIISGDCKIKENLEISNSILGKGITQESNAESERIYYEIEKNEEEEEEKILNVLDKDLFFKNLEDRETLFLCSTPNLMDENNFFDRKENENSEFDEDSDEEESESEEIESDDEEDYENELNRLINIVLNKKSSIEDIIKELAGLKNAFWEKSNSETIKTCLIPIINDFLKGENFNHNHIEKLKEILFNWKMLFNRFVSTEEDMINLISIIEKLCIDINEIKEAFHIFIQIMNSEEVNIISDNSILKWRDKKESSFPTSDGMVIIPDDIHKKNLDKMKKYIEQLE